MTPKEKAQELIEKFNFGCRECDDARLSAIIAVETIIESGHLRLPEDRLYWKMVRKELNKSE